MLSPRRCRPSRFTFRPVARFSAKLLLLLLLLPFGSSAEDGRPQVLGYGVNTCATYIAAFNGWERGEESAIVEYLRYREWFAGLVTGLSLATGREVLSGVEVKDAMRRLQVYCGDNREEDFFRASMTLLRTLSGSE